MTRDAPKVWRADLGMLEALVYFLVYFQVWKSPVVDSLGPAAQTLNLLMRPLIDCDKPESMYISLGVLLAKNCLMIRLIFLWDINGKPLSIFRPPSSMSSPSSTFSHFYLFVVVLEEIVPLSNLTGSKALKLVICCLDRPSATVGSIPCVESV